MKLVSLSGNFLFFASERRYTIDYDPYYLISRRFLGKCTIDEKEEEELISKIITRIKELGGEVRKSYVFINRVLHYVLEVRMKHQTFEYYIKFLKENFNIDYETGFSFLSEDV